MNPGGRSGIRLDKRVHLARPWRIYEVARGLDLEDVWSMPLHGGRDEFRDLVQMLAATDPLKSSSRIVRGLFATRFALGGLLGWDESPASATARTKQSAAGPDIAAIPSTCLYLSDDEWAVQIVNRTVHGVLHIGWVPDGQGAYGAELAIYVKRNGLLGSAYMLAITPFRHLLVYPLAMRDLEKTWRARQAGIPSGMPQV